MDERSRKPGIRPETEDERPDVESGNGPPEPILQELLDAGLVHPVVRTALELAQERARVAEDRLRRELADADNRRKRLHREHEEGLRYGNERLLSRMLPVLDNLERSLAHAVDDVDLRELRRGVELTLAQFQQVLQAEGVEPVPAAPGVPFDPAVHEAVSRDDSADLPAQTISAVLQSGFTYRGRLLRPARVVVASGRGTREEEHERPPMA